MTRTLLGGFALLLVSFTASAEPTRMQLPLDCYNNVNELDEIIQSYDERVFLRDIGRSSGASYTLWINPETRTWTIVKHFSDITCILGFGDELQLRSEWETPL